MTVAMVAAERTMAAGGLAGLDGRTATDCCIAALRPPVWGDPRAIAAAMTAVARSTSAGGLGGPGGPQSDRRAHGVMSAAVKKRVIAVLHVLQMLLLANGG